MNTNDVLDLLKSHRNERGVLNWEKMASGTGGLESFGIGLTQLRKLAKTIGRDHELALELWKSGNYDAKIIALLIDEPVKLTRAQVEGQVEEVGVGGLAHVFSSCDATLSKAPFVFELACEWISSKDALRRSCGYGLIYELSKDLRMAALTDGFFLDCMDRIQKYFYQEDVNGRLAMGCALMGIGKRNKTLNAVAVKLANEFGPIDFNESNGTCEPFDVAKHLTNERLMKKLGIL